MMNKAGGYITIHRKILDWEWYTDYVTRGLFLHLLVAANFADAKFLGKKIKRGQYVTSLSELSKQTGFSIQQIKTALKHLISTNEITNVSTRQYRIITIVKYDEYQTPTNVLTDNQQTPNKQLTNEQQQYNKNNKKNKENKNNSIRGFTPPTIEEVTAYIKEINGTIDPGYFFDHYSASGWCLKGGQKMKDWKATLRNWERREKNGRNGTNGGNRSDGAGSNAESRPKSKWDWLRDKGGVEYL